MVLLIGKKQNRHNLYNLWNQQKRCWWYFWRYFLTDNFLVKIVKNVNQLLTHCDFTKFSKQMPKSKRLNIFRLTENRRKGWCMRVEDTRQKPLAKILICTWPWFDFVTKLSNYWTLFIIFYVDYRIEPNNHSFTALSVISLNRLFSLLLSYYLLPSLFYVPIFQTDRLTKGSVFEAKFWALNQNYVKICWMDYFKQNSISENLILNSKFLLKAKHCQLLLKVIVSTCLRNCCATYCKCPLLNGRCQQSQTSIK